MGDDVKRPLLREVNALAARYQSLLARFGERDRATERAWQAWYDARNLREELAP